MAPSPPAADLPEFPELPELPEDVRARTLARFEAHRQAWAANPALRALYHRWYGRVRAELPDRRLGRWIEIGSGPGLAGEIIPELELSDVVQAPWHAHRLAAESLPFGDGEVGALVLFDVLHHLRSPARFLTEASRVLAPGGGGSGVGGGGGRIVLCEPYVSPLSFPVYRFLHEEGCDLSVDPLAADPWAASGSKGDPFDGNQAIPTRLFGRHRDELARQFPSLRLVKLEHLAGPTYPASGGFSGRPLLPGPLWRALMAIEDRLPAVAFRLIGFRLLAVLERI